MKKNVNDVAPELGVASIPQGLVPESDIVPNLISNKNINFRAVKIYKRNIL